MMTFIGFLIGYLMIGFIYGKLRKMFDDHTKNLHTDYASLAIWWLPNAIIQLIILVYNIYKKYI